MNDINKSDADLTDVEDIDLDELYDEVELDDVEGIDDGIVPAQKKSGREKLWLGLTLSLIHI